MGNRFDYIDHENSKIVIDLVESADQIDVNAVNMENSVRYFLKNDQSRIKIGEPSVSAAEKQMKGLAAIFNDKKTLLQEVIGQIDKIEEKMSDMISKLEKTGNINKINKLKDSIDALETHRDPIAELIVQLDESKKQHLESLRKRILKAERVRHFKNLH